MIRQSIFLRFPQGKKKTVTISYDDAVDQDKILVDMMKKYGVRGTFNISTGWLAKEGTVYPEGETHRRMSVSQCKDTYDLSVCEVAIHGYTHPFTTTLPGAMIMDSVVTDRKNLEDMFGTIAEGMAYAYGWRDDEMVQILRGAGIKYCRTVNESHSFDFPRDWLVLHPTCHHDDKMLPELMERFLIMNVTENPQMFYLWGHTFEFERNDNWERMTMFMEKMSGHDDIWYATNGEIVNYVEASKRLEYSVDGSHIFNPTCTDIWLCIDGKDTKIPAGEMTTR